MEYARVFTSKIKRKNSDCKELHNLLHVMPAVPKIINQSNDTTCTFKPLTGKLYIPKKKSQLKVKTVRDIRREYQKDVYSYLPDEIEKQQQFLFRKIRHGSLRNENIKEIAKKMLNSDHPVSRSAWQMLTNVNPEGHAYAKQFVMCDGKSILINGSRGGKSRFISNVSNVQITGKSQNTKNKSVYTKRSLLRNSLHIRFRPGPLSKKKYLDSSYQKYHVGTADVIKLPKVGLEVQPTLGLPISPSVTTVLNSMRELDGIISEKWAELSVSVLGTIQENKPVQTNLGSSITFDLNYNKNVKKILMRQNSNDKQSFYTEVFSKCQDMDDECVIKSVINDMLSCVEISLKQDNMFTIEPRKTDNIEIFEDATQTKEKFRKKHGGELNRLDVRIIRLNDSEQNAPQCAYKFCELGCVCSSIGCSYKLKGHCGHLDCMFECTCDFSDYKAVDLYESDCSEFVPGLLNLDNELNLTLSKEEKKFHQTIIMTDDKRILLKKQKRNWKKPRKYADFYKNMSLKTDLKADKQLFLVSKKLNIKNVVPWCMVHKLYKCFCKLKYHSIFYQNLEFTNKNEAGFNKGNNKAIINEAKPVDISPKPEAISEIFTNSTLSTSSCARIRLYESCQNSEFYKNTHKKIADMEKDDSQLHDKLLNLVNKDNYYIHNQNCIVDEEIEFQNQDPGSDSISSDKVDIAEASDNSQPLTELEDKDCVKSTSNLLTPELSKVSMQLTKTKLSSGEVSTRSISNMLQKGSLSDDSKLKSWLELNYKKYKNRFIGEETNIRLDAPKPGKVVMYPWKCILSRYRQKKNYFLVMKEHPYCIFLTVDTSHEMFKNCMHITDIKREDLHKYPITIRNLINNVSNLKDSFCILRGFSKCWQLSGSIRKVKDSEPSPDYSCDISRMRLEFSNECTGQNAERDIPVNGSNEYLISDRNSDVSVECGDSNETLKMPVECGDSNETLKMSVECRDSNETLKTSVEYGDSNETLKTSAECGDSNETLKTSVECRDSNETLRRSLRKRKFAAREGNNGETIMESSEKRTLRKKSRSQQSKEMLLEDENKLINVIDTNTKFASEQGSVLLSKWFLMIVENDFHELQFSHRGFFVKYDKIIHSIELSRYSGKVVRLSAKTNVTVLANVPFGIYGIPNNTTELCVFIGPYEINETLGIETVKNPHTTTTNHTRGFWITIDAAKNEEIIQAPLSYVPPQFVQRKDMISVISKNCESKLTTINVTETTSNVNKQMSPKPIKPIKIRKSNQIYYIDPNGMIKEVPKDQTNIQLQPTPKIVLLPSSPLVNSPPKITENTDHESALSVVEDNPPLKQAKVGNGQKPVAEVAPQVNTTVNTLQKDSKPSLSLKGMSILKPEEINKRAVKQNIVSNRDSLSTLGNNDIESFLANTTRCTVVDDVCVISDDDDENGCDNNVIKEVLIECQNAEQFGWISGKIRKDNSLSFQFPGFNFSEFYEHDEALRKITEVLCRKVHIPDISTINCKVVRSQNDLKATYKLTSSGLKRFSEPMKEARKTGTTVNLKGLSLKVLKKHYPNHTIHRVDLQVRNKLYMAIASFYINKKDTVEKRIETNFEAAIKCTGALIEIVLSKISDLNRRVMVYVTVVRPLLLYGSDAWTITQPLKDELGKIEKYVLKVLLNANLTRESLSDDEVQKYMPKTSIVDIIDGKRRPDTSSADLEELFGDDSADCEVQGQLIQEPMKEARKTGTTVNLKGLSLKVLKKHYPNHTIHRVDLQVRNKVYMAIASLYINKKDTVEKRIETNFVAAIKCTGALIEIVLSKMSDLNRRVMVYVTVVRPLLLYGSDAWTITQPLKDELGRIEKKVLKVLLNANLTRESLSDDEVLKYMPKTSIVDIIDGKRRPDTSSIDLEELFGDDSADCEVQGQLIQMLQVTDHTSQVDNETES